MGAPDCGGGWRRGGGGDGDGACKSWLTSVRPCLCSVSLTYDTRWVPDCPWRRQGRGGTWWWAGVGVGDDVGDGMCCTCALPIAAAPLEARKATAQGAAAMTQARGSPTSKPGPFPPPAPPAGQRGGLWYTFSPLSHAATRWPLGAKSSGPMTQGRHAGGTHMHGAHAFDETALCTGNRLLVHV